MLYLQYKAAVGHKRVIMQISASWEQQYIWQQLIHCCLVALQASAILVTSICIVCYVKAPTSCMHCMPEAFLLLCFDSAHTYCFDFSGAYCITLQRTVMQHTRVASF